MNRVRAGYPGQLDDLATTKLSSVHFLLLLTFKLAAGERFERPYPDSKSRVLPLDDPASRFQRYCFHAPYAQHRRFIDVVAKSPAIRTRTIHQVAVFSSAFAIELRCKLDFKAFEFNRLCTHNVGSSEENRTVGAHAASEPRAEIPSETEGYPISALKGPHPGH